MEGSSRTVRRRRPNAGHPSAEDGNYQALVLFFFLTGSWHCKTSRVFGEAPSLLVRIGHLSSRSPPFFLGYDLNRAQVESLEGWVRGPTTEAEERHPQVFNVAFPLLKVLLLLQTVRERERGKEEEPLGLFFLLKRERGEGNTVVSRVRKIRHGLCGGGGREEEEKEGLVAFSRLLLQFSLMLGALGNERERERELSSRHRAVHNRDGR